MLRVNDRTQLAVIVTRNIIVLYQPPKWGMLTIRDPVYFYYQRLAMSSFANQK